MDRMKMAQGSKAGRGFPVMVLAAAMALTVNAAFGLALSNASTHGQRIYDAWYNGDGGSMYADASSALHKLCAKS